MTHIAGTGHQTRDCSPAGLRESCCNPCTVRLLLRFSSTLSVASCNHEGDYHYWVGIDFPRAMAHIARPEPETLQPTRSQTKYMVSKIFQDCPRRPARYYRCLSGIERSKIQDVKPNQPKVFYDILMGRSEAPAAPSAASASRAAARLMDDDSGTLTAKMLKPHHISKSKTPGVDVMCGFQLGKKLEVCGHGWVMLC